MKRQRAIASTDLARMVTCETQFVLDRKHGDRATPSVVRRRQEGIAAHAEHHRNVTAHHNARSARGPCFIATAVCGEFAWQTEALRDFRDAVLARSRLGRIAIGAYYLVSPPLARWLSRSPRAASIVRSGLDRFLRARTARVQRPGRPKP